MTAPVELAVGVDLDGAPTVRDAARPLARATKQRAHISANLEMGSIFI
jgi:hypothetical protein